MIEQVLQEIIDSLPPVDKKEELDSYLESVRNEEEDIGILKMIPEEEIALYNLPKNPSRCHEQVGGQE
jgi:hypothetical protein